MSRICVEINSRWM